MRSVRAPESPPPKQTTSEGKNSILPLRRPIILNSEMSSTKKGKQRLSSQARALIRKLRKPMAPPTRVAPDESKYSRARERELVRRTVKK